MSAAFAVAFALAAPPTAATTSSPQPAITPLGPAAEQAPPRLDAIAAERIAFEHPKVLAWLARYPRAPTTSARFRVLSGTWVVKAWSGEAGQIVQVVVEDTTGRVSEAWTGPQVAWKMARGAEGSFGGKTLLKPYVWLAFCLVFLLGLADLRRPLSLPNLDLLVLLGFSVSLVFFNEGEIFRSVPLVYPALGYVLLRSLWVGIRGRERHLHPIWPTWAIAVVAVFILGFRVGLNVETPRGVIDVGLAGVAGASRVLDGQAPYGNMPRRGDLEPCGPEDADGQIRDRIQTNGRCESAIERGDTYGPVSYLTYVPATLAFGWSGKWDSLPAAHATSIAFDLLTVLGLVLVGLRFGGVRLAALLAFAWTAYPFTAYALNANTNDTIMPALLVLGFWLVSSAWARGAAVALAGWAKFGALLVAPLWASYPTLEPRRVFRFALAFVAATGAAFAILLLEPDVWEALRTFWDRTLGFQLGRDSPFSLWGWGQYHAKGIPDLGFVQPALAAFAFALALLVAFVPRQKGPIELAALTAAVLVAVQLALSHWFYLYLPWVFPFVAFWLLLPAESRAVVGARHASPEPGVPGSYEAEIRTASIDEALPVSASHSISAPSMRTSP